MKQELIDDDLLFEEFIVRGFNKKGEECSFTYGIFSGKQLATIINNLNYAHYIDHICVYSYFPTTMEGP